MSRLHLIQVDFDEHNELHTIRIYFVFSQDVNDPHRIQLLSVSIYSLSSTFTGFRLKMMRNYQQNMNQSYARKTEEFCLHIFLLENLMIEKDASASALTRSFIREHRQPSKKNNNKKQKEMMQTIT